MVYWKCIDSWKDQGIVIGQEGQQVLVKHGSAYVQVHPCRLELVERGTSFCDNDLIQKIDEIELDKTNSSKKEKYFCNPNKYSGRPVKCDTGGTEDCSNLQQHKDQSEMNTEKQRFINSMESGKMVSTSSQNSKPMFDICQWAVRNRK